MARRFTHGRNIVGNQRRKSTWIALTISAGQTFLAGNTSVIDQTLTGFNTPVTVVRTRGKLWIASDQIAVNEVVIGSMGFAIVTEQALAAGVGSVPTLSTDAQSDSWFVHEFFAQKFGFGNASGFVNQSFTLIEFDSKAMRKISPEERLIVVLENSSAVGMAFVIDFRFLLKLP